MWNRVSLSVVGCLIGMMPISYAGAATLASYTFGSPSATSLSSTDTDPSVASDLTIGGGLTGSGFSTTNGNPPSSYSIPDTAVEGQATFAQNDFVQFSITPAPSFSLNQFSFDGARWDNGGTGRVHLYYRLNNTSTLTYLTDFAINNGGFQNYSTALPSVLSNVSQPVWFSLLFSRSGSDSGSQLNGRGTYIDNISVTGAPVPLPATFWLFASATLGFARFFRRT